jgi:hypothetical protein
VAVYPVVWAWKFIKMPGKMDYELREQIATLENRLKPALQFTWRPEENKFLEVVEKRSTFPAGARTVKLHNSVKVGRVAIKNMSYAESIIGAHVSLVNYESGAKEKYISVDKRLIARSTGEPIVNLDHRRE